MEVLTFCKQLKGEALIKAYWKGFRVLEVRDFNNSKWGHTVQIAVYSTMHSNLMWVEPENIELRWEEDDD